jgi:hypothetical protein
MEGQTTPTPATPEVVVTTPSAEATVTSPSSSSFSEGGALGSITSGKMNVKDIVISALLVVLSVYGIYYYRKALKKIEEQPTADELQDMSDDIEELKYNVKKAMGSKYETT